MAKDTEIEIQVQVEKIAPLLQFLAKKAKLIGKVRQIDQYFTPFHRNFLAVRPAAEWLRLRTSSGKHFINYKFWHHSKKTGQSNWADEFETEIKAIAPLEKIFSALNFKPVVTVDKRRDIWLYKDYEIAIDRVKGLGDFIEQL